LPFKNNKTKNEFQYKFCNDLLWINESIKFTHLFNWREIFILDFARSESTESRSGLWMFSKAQCESYTKWIPSWHLNTLEKQLLFILQWCDLCGHPMLHNYCIKFWTSSCGDGKKMKIWFLDSFHTIIYFAKEIQKCTSARILEINFNMNYNTILKYPQKDFVKEWYDLWRKRIAWNWKWVVGPTLLTGLCCSLTEKV